MKEMFVDKTTYDEAKRHVVIEIFWALLIGPALLGVICYWGLDNLAFAGAVAISTVVILLLVSPYYWAAVKRSQALMVAPVLDGVLQQFFQLLRPEVRDSLSKFFGWRQEYYRRHGAVLGVLTYIRDNGQLPDAHLLRDVSAGEVDYLHQQARLVAR